MNKAKDIQQFAKEMLGYEILPFQIKVVEAIINGKQIKYVTEAGRATAKRVALAYMERQKVQL